MAHDFLGNELSIGDDVVFLNYVGTSASLERGKITRVSEHTAEISGKRRAEYKIVKVNPVKPTMDNTWIPCSERLPESDEVWQKYIVAYRYRYRDIWDDIGGNAVVTVADYCHEQKVWSMDGGVVINALIDSEDVQPWASYITHWQPLPELPEEENDETIDG